MWSPFLYETFSEVTVTKEEFIKALQEQDVEVIEDDGVPVMIVDEMPSSERAYKQCERAIRDLGYTASFGIRKRQQ